MVKGIMKRKPKPKPKSEYAEVVARMNLYSHQIGAIADSIEALGAEVESLKTRNPNADVNKAAFERIERTLQDHTQQIGEVADRAATFGKQVSDKHNRLLSIVLSKSPLAGWGFWIDRNGLTIFAKGPEKQLLMIREAQSSSATCESVAGNPLFSLAITDFHCISLNDALATCPNIEKIVRDFLASQP